MRGQRHGLVVLSLAALAPEPVRPWLDPKYHLDNKPQMLDALEFAQPKCPSGLVLDIGANGGKETEHARKKGYEVISVECLNREFLRLSDKWKHDTGITLLNGCASNALSLHSFHEANAGSSLHAQAVAQDSELVAFKNDRGEDRRPHGRRVAEGVDLLREDDRGASVTERHRDLIALREWSLPE